MRAASVVSPPRPFFSFSEAAVAEILAPVQQQAFVAHLERELDLQRAQLLTERQTLEAVRSR